MPFGPEGWQLDSLGAEVKGRVIVTACEEQDDEWWVHASISWANRLPSYDDLKLLHAAVFGDGWAYLPFAPPAEHVNHAQYALHLFGRLDGAASMPDFTRGLKMI